jgi:hypothetical protein
MKIEHTHDFSIRSLLEIVRLWASLKLGLLECVLYVRRTLYKQARPRAHHNANHTPIFGQPFLLGEMKVDGWHREKAPDEGVVGWP